MLVLLDTGGTLIVGSAGLLVLPLALLSWAVSLATCCKSSFEEAIGSMWFSTFLWLSRWLNSGVATSLTVTFEGQFSLYCCGSDSWYLICCCSCLIFCSFRISNSSILYNDSYNCCDYDMFSKWSQGVLLVVTGFCVTSLVEVMLVLTS